MDTAIFIANLLVNIWLLIVVHRHHVRKQLPWFVLYVVWEVVSGGFSLAIWLLGRQLYGSLYWWMEAIEIALIVAAVRESFLRAFRGFTSKPGFRWSVWTVIGGVIVYAAWRALYGPALQHNKFGSFEMQAEFLFRWGIFGIALLTTALGFLLKESPETREDAVVIGFGVASAGFLAYVITISILTKKYIFLSQLAPSVGYFLTVFWWLWVFSRPDSEFGIEELGMGPEDIGKVLRRYRQFGERLVRKQDGNTGS